jgi:hypothetical protein
MKNVKPVRVHSSKGRETQSYRLYKLFGKKNRTGVSRDEITKTLNVKPEYVGSYLAEFKRVYGADVNYNADRARYELKNQNRLNVPKEGSAGRKSL